MIICKFCNKECRLLTSDRLTLITEWWKCEDCDVSYLFADQELVQQNLFVRLDDKVYCLRVHFQNKRSSLDYRTRPPQPLYPAWSNIAQFKSALTFSPLELREKLPLLLLFS